MDEGRPTARAGEGLVIAAFVTTVVVGGINFVAVKFTVAELAPFWGAAMRFALASLILAWIAVPRRLPWPHGRALVGAVVFGVLAFAASYAFAYFALVGISAGLLSILVATVPLATILLARVHGLEPLSMRNLAGSVVVIAGIGVILGDQLVASVSLPHLVAGCLMPLSIAESNVLLKKFPRVHPIPLNATAMVVGTVLLLAVSLIVGEPMALPREKRTIAAVLYLVVVGSVTLFTLFLFVMGRWTASKTSFGFVLTPIVGVIAASIVAHESFSWTFFLGAAIVLSGVYIAAVPPRRPTRAATGGAAPQSAASTTGAPRP